MSAVIAPATGKFEALLPVLIIGAGAAGLCAALAAKDVGADAVVVERDGVQPHFRRALSPPRERAFSAPRGSMTVRSFSPTTSSIKRRASLIPPSLTRSRAGPAY